MTEKTRMDQERLDQLREEEKRLKLQKEIQDAERRVKDLGNEVAPSKKRKVRNLFVSAAKKVDKHLEKQYGPQHPIQPPRRAKKKKRPLVPRRQNLSEGLGFW